MQPEQALSVGGIAPVISIHRLGQEPKQRHYWLTRPVAERVAMVKTIRSEYHGWDDATEPRLERVCRIVKR